MKNQPATAAHCGADAQAVRRADFAQSRLTPLLAEARALGLTKEDLISMMKERAI